MGALFPRRPPVAVCLGEETQRERVAPSPAASGKPGPEGVFLGPLSYRFASLASLEYRTLGGGGNFVVLACPPPLSPVSSEFEESGGRGAGVPRYFSRIRWLVVCGSKGGSSLVALRSPPSPGLRAGLRVTGFGSSAQAACPLLLTPLRTAKRRRPGRVGAGLLPRRDPLWLELSSVKS